MRKTSSFEDLGGELETMTKESKAQLTSPLLKSLPGQGDEVDKSDLGEVKIYTHMDTQSLVQDHFTPAQSEKTHKAGVFTTEEGTIDWFALYQHSRYDFRSQPELAAQVREEVEVKRLISPRSVYYD
mmetsp:Transcript_2109/g.3726  ORF Transcript_2109/g.3726 Transcript_2109/m.3726 type:complete len:127 (-) Transcript_2109:914-1294(-)